MATIAVAMVYEKETKNTVKFKATAEFPPIESLYINKRDLREKGVTTWPSDLNVVVTFSTSEAAK